MIRVRGEMLDGLQLHQQETGNDCFQRKIVHNLGF